MNVSYVIQLKMGHELNSNGVDRLKELINEALKPIGTEFLADVTVTTSLIVPGPHHRQLMETQDKKFPYEWHIETEG